MCECVRASIAFSVRQCGVRVLDVCVSHKGMRYIIILQLNLTYPLTHTHTHTHTHDKSELIPVTYLLLP